MCTDVRPTYIYPFFQAVVQGAVAETEDEVRSAVSAWSVVEKRARPWVDQIVVRVRRLCSSRNL